MGQRKISIQEVVILDILQYIPHGKENAISRNELSSLLKMPDRQVRKLIEQKRQKGIPILSSSRSGGYWLSEDVSEIRAFLKEAENRIKTEKRNTVQIKRRYDAGANYTIVREHTRRLDKTDNVEGQIGFAEA